jgi:hypothetical protein
MVWSCYEAHESARGWKPGLARSPAKNEEQGARVKKTSDYQEHAHECRVLARKMQGRQRDQLLKMAATWERLAADSSVLIRRHPELGRQGHDSREGSAEAQGAISPTLITRWRLQRPDRVNERLSGSP